MSGIQQGKQSAFPQNFNIIIQELFAQYWTLPVSAQGRRYGVSLREALG